jgi:hypothetical protein
MYISQFLYFYEFTAFYLVMNESMLNISKRIGKILNRTLKRLSLVEDQAIHASLVLLIVDI